MKETSNPEFYYQKGPGLLDDSYEIYLKCSYSKQKFEQEIDRLKNIPDSYEGEEHVIRYDEENFIYPAYVSIYNSDSTYEYALVNEAEETIYYIHLQFVGEESVEWDTALLPFHYLDETQEVFNMYAYEDTELGGWYINNR